MEPSPPTLPPQLSDSAPLEGPPPRLSSTRSTLLQDLGQGLEYVRFIWRVSTRIRGWRNRCRFIVGLILWKPFLPKDGLD
ncbi:hypothetical protein [Pseudanabaena sp. FACHB-2040]|uniref:hypothetical protein n=1 Tax=Pseudanabaena sp. FACHB-2040 TaxID=2692859 RepID=UPI001683FCD8|nr:hypothetical protein [Pseudanabaena sp. FACHB-2040]MBD2257580.1 hypothetical protein [Pseudanabaena sp. FACHB-2040]